MRKSLQRGRGQWEERGEGEGDRGFPLLVCSCREEDPGAGNRLDECVIPVENCGCHGQHSSLIRESGLQPHYSAWLITAYVYVDQTDTHHTHTHTPSRCSPPVILAKFWPMHKVTAREEGKNSEKKAHHKGKLKHSARLCLVCGLSSSVNRAAAVSMLACHYLIKNWWLLHRAFKLFCLWTFNDWCCTNTTTTKNTYPTVCLTHTDARRR